MGKSWRVSLLAMLVALMLACGAVVGEHVQPSQIPVSWEMTLTNEKVQVDEYTVTMNGIDSLTLHPDGTADHSYVQNGKRIIEQTGLQWTTQQYPDYTCIEIRDFFIPSIAVAQENGLKIRYTNGMMLASYSVMSYGPSKDLKIFYNQDLGLMWSRIDASTALTTK